MVDPSQSAPTSDTAWVAVVSTDPEFRNRVREMLDGQDLPVALALAIDCPFGAITDLEEQELRKAGPEILVVDLESDQGAGLEFIRSTLEAGHVSGVIAASRNLSQEVLLQGLEAGVSEMIAKPLDPDQAAAAMGRMLRKTGRATRPDEQDDEEEGRILALFGAKGGVGTTAIATNLAVAIRHLTGERTLLLDLDIEQGETAFLLGMSPQLGLLDLLRNFQPEVSGLLAACIDHDETSGVDLLAAPLHPAGVRPEELELLSGESMRQVLAFLRRHYRYIVIDRPKSFHPAFDCVLEEADAVYLITTPDLQALRNITRSLPLLRRVSSRGDGRRLHLVVNRYPTQPTLSKEEIEETVGMKVYHILGADFHFLNESIHERTPAVLQGTSGFAKDIRSLAQKVAGVEVESGRRKGLLGGLIGAMRGGR
ncbi:MAG: AAA family ATPase [Gemmatimonadota bacterium]